MRVIHVTVFTQKSELVVHIQFQSILVAKLILNIATEELVLTYYFSFNIQLILDKTRHYAGTQDIYTKSQFSVLWTTTATALWSAYDSVRRLEHRLFACSINL